MDANQRAVIQVRPSWGGSRYRDQPIGIANPSVEQPCQCPPTVSWVALNLPAGGTEARNPITTINLTDQPAFVGGKDLQTFRDPEYAITVTNRPTRACRPICVCGLSVQVGHLQQDGASYAGQTSMFENCSEGAR